MALPPQTYQQSLSRRLPLPHLLQHWADTKAVLRLSVTLVPQGEEDRRGNDSPPPPAVTLHLPRRSIEGPVTKGSPRFKRPHLLVTIGGRFLQIGLALLKISLTASSIRPKAQRGL